MTENMVLYAKNKLTASNRRILTTKWIANTWNIIKADKELIRRSLFKCGLSNNLDGSMNHLVNIRGLEGYSMLKLEQQFLPVK